MSSRSSQTDLSADMVRACAGLGRVLGAMAASLSLLSLGAACARGSPERAAAPRPAVERAGESAPEGQLPRDVRPISYDIELDIEPERERFSGHVRIAVELARATSTIWLHAQSLNVTRAVIELADGPVAANLREVNGDGLARLGFSRLLPAGRAVLDLVYDAAFDRHLSGLYKVETDGLAYAFTQFEPIHARKAFPCFDEPVFKTPFEVSLVVKSDQTAISNAKERAVEPAGPGKKRVRFAPTPPLPTYLMAFLVGPLEVVQAEPIPPSALRPRALPLRGIAVKNQGRRLGYALRNAGPLLLELERYFGIPYPFEKLDLIAVPDFAPGAMENAGAITFREWFLLIDAQGASEAQRRAYTSVTAHEIAHHWTGDLVTMPWWDDIWLNEAFATFMATRTVSAVHPEYRADMAQLSSVLGVMDVDSRVSARKIRQPIASTHDITNAFDGITYQKGAGVLAMFERYLGAENFRAGVGAYLRAHAYATANAADLLAALGRAAGKDVAGPMSSFLDQAGVPLVRFELACKGDVAELGLRQARYVPAGSRAARDQRWQIPICLRYGSGGHGHEQCMLLTEAEQRVRLEQPGCPDWLLPNADGAGYYRWALAPRDFERLRVAGYAQLNARERLSLVDALRSGFASGELHAEQLLASLPILAGDADRSVATAPMEFLRFARERLLDAAARPALDRFALALYEPRLRALGWRDRGGDDGETKLLRADVASFLALVIRDPQVRAEAARLGRALLAAPADGTAARGAASVAVDLRSLVATVAVQEGDLELFDAVQRRLASVTEPGERERWLGALVAVSDARRERALSLTFDPLLRVNEALVPLRAQFADERTRPAAWEFLQAHFDELVKRIDKERASSLPLLAASFCESDMAKPIEAFFGPRIESLRGGPRVLNEALESLRLCAAKVELQRASARAFFASQRSH